MFGCFKLFRLSASFFLSILLFLTIIVGIPLSSFSELITDKETIKTWLDKGNVYDNIVDSATDVIFDNIAYNEATDQINLSKDELETVISSILTKDWLKIQTEGFLDESYLLLDGSKDRIDFVVDISERKDEVATAMGTVLKDKLSAMETCTAEQVPTDGSFDPFKANCIPSGLNVNDEVDAIVDQLLNEGDFLSDATYSTEDVTFDRTIVQTLQRMYTVAQTLPVITMIAIIVITLILFVIVPGYKNGFFVTGLVWFISSALLLFGGYYARDNFERYYQDQQLSVEGIDSEVISETLHDPVELIFNDIIAESSKLGLVVIVLGMILLFGGIILRFSRRTYYVKGDKDFKPDKGKTPDLPLPEEDNSKQAESTQKDETTKEPYHFVDEKTGKYSPPPEVEKPKQEKAATTSRPKPKKKKKRKKKKPKKPTGPFTEVKLR